MDIATFAVESEVTRSHWWFRGRRRLFARTIESLGIGSGATILDVGTGTGTNLRMLRDLGYTAVRGIEPSPEAIGHCAEHGFDNVTCGDATALPIEDDSCDLLLATDVIEHIDDDAAALREMRRVLRPSGHLLLSVPAFPSLWGRQDEVAHHRRRYRMRPLCELLGECGFTVVRRHHFNAILFVPIFVARRLMKWFGLKPASENSINAPGLNALLTAIFSVDVAVTPRVRPPFGVSILVVAQPTGAAT